MGFSVTYSKSSQLRTNPLSRTPRNTITVNKNNPASDNKNFELKEVINRQLSFYEHIGHEQVYIRCCRVNFCRQNFPVQ